MPPGGKSGRGGKQPPGNIRSTGSRQIEPGSIGPGSIGPSGSSGGKPGNSQSNGDSAVHPIARVPEFFSLMRVFHFIELSSIMA
jgi:hypothetical protein